MGRPPIYKGCPAPRSYPVGANAGLWYDKFCNEWSDSWELGENTKQWVGQFARPVGSRRMLEEFTQRMAQMVRALGGRFRCFRTDWRFVTGLGRNHPVENGFGWHHLLGVPFLPGSSVKGVVRAWADGWIENTDGEEIARIFGPKGKDAEKSVGSVIFFDAVPVEPVKVEADVMTPHYGPYYQPQGPPQPPGDWFAPVPIPFLTVAPGQAFLFAVVPRRVGCRENEQDCRQVLEWLQDALASIGAGAKTAVGYGRFQPRADLEEKLERSWRQSIQASSMAHDGARAVDSGPAAPGSAIKAEMDQDGYNSDPDRFMMALTTKWLAKMTAPDTGPAEQREIALLLAEWYQTQKPKQWKKPNRKNRAKIAQIMSVLER